MTLQLQKVDIFLHALCYIAKRKLINMFCFYGCELESDKLQHNFTKSAQLNSNRLVSLRFKNRGVKPILTITDLYQCSLSFRRFSRNLSANTSLLFSLITIYCTNANRVLELTTPAKPSLSKLQMNRQQQWMKASLLVLL